MRDDRLYLVHILECIGFIEGYVQEGRHVFLNDRKTRHAVLRDLHTMAESTQRLSDALKVAHSGVNWRQIGAFRNVLVHDYLGISADRIWEVIRRDLPELKRHVEAMLQEMNGQENTSES